MTIDGVISELVSTVSCGGNVLINVGPAHDGTIAPLFVERLMQLGSWLAVNGEAIYSSSPWRAQNDTAAQTWYTMNNASGAVYAILLAWPPDGVVNLVAPTPVPAATVSLLGSSAPVTWSTRVGGGMVVKLPELTVTDLPCEHAWTLKLDGVK